MRYFELFNIPVSLQVDQKLLSARYFTLQRQYHPDLFVQSAPEEQEAALELSSLINQAFKTLKSPDDTIRYVLKEKGLLQEEEKYQLSPDFLVEMMELNEQLEENEDITAEADRIQKEIYEPVKTIIADYQESVATEEELLQVKEYYFRKKYLDRIGKQH